jgi:hypothetical protein
MPRKDIPNDCSSFSQIDDLTREISELAGMVNARFVVDDDKINGLKSLSRRGTAGQPADCQVVNG